jgi:PAS domain S-box-containing protein
MEFSRFFCAEILVAVFLLVIAAVFLGRELKKQGLSRSLLQESEEKYRRLVEISPDAILVGDDSQRIVYANPAARRMLQAKSLEDLAGRSYLDFVHPEDRDLSAVRVSTMPEGEFRPTRCHRLVGLEGKTIHVESTGVVFSYQGKKMLQGVFRDITDRWETEGALRESEKRFREMAELLPEVIFQIDLEGNISFINQRAFSLFGYEPEDLARGINAFEVLMPEERRRAAENIRRVLDGEEVGAIHYQCQKKDGSLFPGLIFSSPVIRNGKIVGLLGCVIDISNLKKTEEALRQSEEKYRQIMEHAPAGIYEVDFVRKKFVAVNDMMCHYTGYSQEEFLSMSPFDILTEESQRLFGERLKKILSGEPVPEVAEYRIKDKNKKERWVLISARYLCDQGKPRGATVVVHDITEKKKMEEEIQKGKKLESLGVLSGGIAHDFNNFLTAILGNLSLAKLDTDPAAEAYRLLEEAEKAAARAKDLTLQLLTFSKGGMPVRKLASLKEVIRESAEFVLRGSKAKPNFSFPEDLWAAEVDIGQISQVIQNLVINAEQAMPQGGVIEVRAENVFFPEGTENPGTPGKYLKITVQDRGMGIPEDHLPRIFDPYFTTKQKGSGLGLATAYAIVKKHEGCIEVHSTLGAGTLFQIFLPASEKPSPEKIVEGEQAMNGNGRVLVMDDEEMIRGMFDKILSRMGYEVESAREGSEAVSLYQRARESGRTFDAVILDLTVPGGLGGKETFEQLRDLDPGVKAIVSSGYSNDPILAKYEDYGFKGMVAKPFDFSELSRTLKAVIHDRRAV